LSAPLLETRKTILDVLTFFIHARDFQAFPLVIDALTTLSTTNDETATPYGYWFKSMEKSLVVSNRKRRAGRPDSPTNDYAVCTLIVEVPARLLTRF